MLAERCGDILIEVEVEDMIYFEKLKKKYQDYLTFYHECRIPKHPFFDISNNRKSDRVLVVSSPSRMGNHLLMSMLDGHPELPSTPGEDGFHMFSFTQCNYDIKSYLQRLRSENVVEHMMDIASNGGGSKWCSMKKLADSSSSATVGYSGVDVGKCSATMDFEGYVANVKYADYREYLEDNKKALMNATRYNDVFNVYLRSLMKLSPYQNESRYDSYLVHGAMRTQLLWICETMPNSKVLTSVRSFDSYAVSQIKSRYGDVKLTKKLLETAWDHWFHKVVDILYLRVHYPDQVGLVQFDSLVNGDLGVQHSICDFLSVSQSDTMSSATIMGDPVRGNSWKSRTAAETGVFYSPSERLDDSEIPQDHRDIWDLVTKVSL